MRIAGAFRRSDTLVSVLRAEDGSFVDVNAAFEAALGWSIEQLVGLRPIDIDLWPDLEVRARLWAQLRSGNVVVAEAVGVRARDGRILPMRVDVEMVDHEGGLFLLCLARPDANALKAADNGNGDRGSYRSLYLAASEGIFRSLPARGFIDVNPAMARIFGFDTPEQMLREASTDSSRLYVDQAHARLVQARLDGGGRIEQARAQVYRRDGSIIWISENVRAVRDENGRVLFHEGSVVDITAAVAAENAVRQSEALYRILVDNCRDGVYLIQRGKIVFANEALASMLGYQAEELFGIEYMSLVDPADHAAQLHRRAQREAGSQEVQRYHVHLLRKDGGTALFSVHADAVEFDGDIASAGVMRDITEEYRQRQALEQAERRYRELFEESPVGLFRTHRDGRILEVNPTMARLLGFESPEELKQHTPSMDQVYADPTERQRLIDRVARDGGIVDHELQIRGRALPLWVSANIRVLRSVDGSMHFAGSVQDISQRRRVEQALLLSESKYRTLVEHSQVGVYIMQDGRLTYVNAAFATMLGMPERELRGKPLRELLAPEHVEAAEQYLLQRASGEGSAGELETCLQPPGGRRIFVTVSAGLVELDGVAHITGTVRDITRHREAEQRLKFHATHDPLTGLPNRLLFQQRLGDALREARSSGVHDYVVLFLDLDGFKLVNDSLGHAAGDRLLVSLAEKLALVLQGEALVARYGGDEFTVLPTVPCSRERAEALAERILRLFAAPFDIGGQQVFSGSSVGIVVGRPEYRTPDQVLRDADTAMYRAKALGKSAFVVFDEEMHRAARQRFELETDFRLAFERNEFCVHYQPIVDLASGQIRGCEALVRWQHPTRGLLLPGDFLTVAEETGLIAALDWWVMEEACRRVAGWHARHPAHAGLRLNVNVDERQLAGRNLVASVQAVLDDTGITPQRLMLEVTETVFRGGRDAAQHTLDRLKALGIGLVVDDFGTGYSSLDSFASSPFDALKIDRNFVRDVETNLRHRAIVRTITGFAEDLGLALTAEGIESEGQRHLLLALHCREGQGFLFSPALPAPAFEQLLQQRSLPLTA